MIEVKLSGRYRLEEKVADGAVASVWRANDEVLDRAVAVKILHPDLAADDWFRERFRLEALSAARLTHPNIVATYDTGDGAGERERSPYLVMEHLEGGTLRQRLDAGLRLPPAQVARIGVEVCAALSHAHANGIVHRDLKPSNILFGESGHAKVSDFGLPGGPPASPSPRPEEPDSEETGPMGTGIVDRTRYRSPEQMHGSEGDARSDLYALGVILYEALTGQAPFTGSSDLAAAIKRQTAGPTRPQQLRPEIPRGLDEVVAKALQPSPEDRFGDAAEMRRALVALVAAEDGEDEPAAMMRATLPPPGPPEPSSFVKTEGRWLLPALLAVVVVGVIVAAAIKPSIVKRIAQPFSGGGSQAEAVTIQASGAYDPPPGGDGSEHNEEVAKAFDGNGQTQWRTNGYTTADFGRLKSGLGIWFDTGRPVSLTQIKVISSAGGWQGTIRTSDDGRTWTAPGAPEAAAAEHVFKTSGRHRWWMLWITRLTRAPGIGEAGNSFGVGINEIQPGAG